AGPAPAPSPVAVTRDRGVCGERTLPEALLVGAGGGVRHAVIRVEGVTRGKRPAGDVVIDNARCRFTPRVAAVMAGDRVRVRNSDAVLHSTHFGGRSSAFTLALPHRDQVIDVTRRLTRPDVFRLACEAHPHMSGWLVVHDSPYVAVTDERGAFRIDAVPPGTYRVTLWHEGFRRRGADRDGRPLHGEPRAVTRDVTIAPRSAATVEFELR
ncbi:MAG TPA: carboxypeptidase regulatory-like domain-containing protein, partial [Methylomirabilota bacterium]|nr:carboxypeptidase regulatory-like domain-containing protein [Methylomirabilota bacterium]